MHINNEMEFDIIKPMSPNYPYQLVTFIDSTPAIGEAVYQGKNGWYPQVALKRRFNYENTFDETVIKKVKEFFAAIAPFEIETGTLITPDDMPVRVIEVLNSDPLKKLHLQFIEYMGSTMHSRYPERDGVNYFPHITAEYDGSPVIHFDDYTNRTFKVTSVCLIKDGEGGDSYLIAKIPLS